ncbi:MAG: GGDEF domain-containing protein [Gammaproteobacteria bacterium]|nr:GGDEF domain-containing protein [Gammaproteobacteria bacterium]
MDSAQRFSLTKYANYGIVAVTIAVILAVAICLWIIHTQHRTRDVAITELLAFKNAQILSQQLAVNRQSLDEGALQATLEALFETDGYVVIRDAADRIVVQTGDTDSSKDLVRAEVSVTGTDWRLEVGRPASGDVLAYFFEGTPIWMVLFVAIAFVALSFRALATVATELKYVGRFLRQIDSGPFSVDPPPCEIEETAQLLPTIQRIALDLQKKEQTIEKLSFTDNVTKLPNRLYFFERFRHAFELAKRGNEICILMLEVNEFQKTDEILGHECADAILRLLADTLQHHTRKSDFAARLGPSSFAAIFYNARVEFMPTRLKELQQNFSTRQKDSIATGGEVHCTLSCVMTYVDTGRDGRAEDTFSRAENALRSVKKLGGNQLAVIESSDKDDEPPAVTASG